MAIASSRRVISYSSSPGEDQHANATPIRPPRQTQARRSSRNTQARGEQLDGVQGGTGEPQAHRCGDRGAQAVEQRGTRARRRRAGRIGREDIRSREAPGAQGLWQRRAPPGGWPTVVAARQQQRPTA
jgi:hypothetical protein